MGAKLECLVLGKQVKELGTEQQESMGSDFCIGVVLIIMYL